MRCIASLRVHLVYCEPDATAHCDASLHNAGIELESIQVLFNDAMRHNAMRYVYCEPTFRSFVSVIFCEVYVHIQNKVLP